MRSHVTIGLIGDFAASVPAHRAIPSALQIAATTLGAEVCVEWMATDAVLSASTVAVFDGLWCVPASPYRSMNDALFAIRHARERGMPYLGTCGGFQHAVVEYARNVLGWGDAEHAETAPGATRQVIAPLQCALIEAKAAVRLEPGMRIARAYGTLDIAAQYHCRYGLNPMFRAALVAGPLRTTGIDGAGDVRAIELDDHPFFVAPLFQPERAALEGKPVPLANSFLQACLR